MLIKIELVLVFGLDFLVNFCAFRGSFWAANLHVLDAERNPIMQIKGPCCICDGKTDKNKI
jgi:hypothetical protein